MASFGLQYALANIHAGIYSTCVATSYKIFVDNSFNLEFHGPRLVAFWLLFSCPTGIAWNKLHDKLKRRLFGPEIASNKLNFTYLMNKKFMAFQVAFNHFGYQALFVPAFFFYLQNVHHKSPNKKAFPTLTKEDIWDLLFARAKVSLVTIITQIGIEMREAMLGVSLRKTRNLHTLLVPLLWHDYLLYKFFEKANAEDTN
eukprot:TRINITY_DN5102_c0_g1_i3.p1 TRINITY_DN5102_c0_g1~~TRINITY_DN5102_c0_g1_i3.p1  ORF type:complete len:200 (-),score=18.84 TRINITY_DN5102_c0_g1_i3:383-982(-)